MTDEAAKDGTPDGPAAPTPAKRSSRWFVGVFLVLLGGMVVVNQCVSTGGPEIDWVENDLEAALQQITPDRPRVFAYLYDPHDPTHARNEREVFSLRWAREPLAHAICCRIALTNDLESEKLRQRFVYKGEPLFLLIDKGGTPVSRAEGAVDRRQFSTYIGAPAEQAWRNAQQAGGDG